jgi:hypothetical protein
MKISKESNFSTKEKKEGNKEAKKRRKERRKGEGGREPSL